MKIKERFQKDSNAIVNIAIAFADKGDHQKAREYFQKAIEVEPKIPENYFIFGSYLLEFIMKERIWRFGLTADNIEELKKAEKLLTQAIGILKDTDRRKELEDAYINRSSIRVILDDYVHALEDMGIAISLNPDSAHAYANRARLNAIKKELNNAVDDFQCSLNRGANKDELFPLLVTCLLDRPDPRPDEAMDFIKKYYSESEIESNIIPGTLWVESLIEKKSYDDANKMLAKLYIKFGKDPRILLTEADLKRKQGDTQGFETLSQEARQTAIGVEKNIAEVQLAKHYKNIGLYEKAIPLFESFISLALFDDILRDYLICLYKVKQNRSNNLEKCLKICRDLKSNGQQIPFLLELEAAICEEMDRLEDALKLYLDLTKIESTNLRHKVNTAKILIDIGKEKDRAVKLMEELKDRVSDKDSLIILGRSFFKVQEYDEAIKQVFKALEMDFGNPEIQLSYLSIFLNRKEKKSGLLDSDVVREDFFVKIKKSGQEQEYLISNNTKATITKFELYKDSGLGKMLYGKRIGESISTTNEYGVKETIEILDIKSKYVKAFQQILDNFDINFPDQKAIFKVQADPDKLKELLERASDRSSQIMKMYQSKNITIGALSAFSGKSLFVCWGALVGQNAKIYCASGSAIEQKREQEIISGASKVLLEPITLFTLGHLDLLDLPSKNFSEVYVTQATIDEIDAEIMELRKSEDMGLTTIFSVDGKAFRDEISAENIKLKIKFLEKIRNCNYFNVIGLERPMDEIMKEREKIFGTPYTYSIQACLEKGIPLFCDDYLFRELINNEYKIKSFGMQNFLVLASQRNLLAESIYFEKILELGRLGYSYLSVSSKMLFFCLEKANFKLPNKDCDVLINILSSKETSLDSLIAVLTDFMRSIMIESLPAGVKDDCLDLILDILAPRGNPRKILKLFQDVLSKKLGLVNHLMIDINRKIDQWIKIHYPVL